jgi:hypothetical protein
VPQAGRGGASEAADGYLEGCGHYRLLRLVKPDAQYSMPPYSEEFAAPSEQSPAYPRLRPVADCPSAKILSVKM